MMRSPMIAAAFFLCVCTVGYSAGTQAPLRSKLYQTSRARLALARARGDRTFSVMLAAAPGKNAKVAAAIVAAGGTVLRRADEVDYLEAKIPVNQVEAIAERSDVTSLDADASITVLAPTPAPSPTASASPKPRTAADEAPLLHPYFPQTALQMTALRTAHPEYDGRGVTVAVVDGTPDFLLPELQYGKSTDGADIPKFVDLRTADSPNSEDPYTVWLSTQTVQAVNGAFTLRGVRYATPYDGAFRFVLVGNQKVYKETVKQIFPANGGSEPPTFGVLWDERTGMVWVDTKRSRDFREARGIQDYVLHHEYGTFSLKPSDPDARPTIGFVVQTDAPSHHVAVLFGNGSHATGSAGSIAASREGRGRIEGIAPGACLYSISPGENAGSIVDAVIEAARNPAVNAIDLEFISALSYGLHDGRFTESVIFDRVTRHFRKPIFQPANNDFGLTQVSESCGSPLVFCIGAYESRDSYLKNAGIAVARQDNLHFVDSFGPSGTGAMRPQVLAPSGWLGLTLGYTAHNNTLKGLFNLPPGYGIFGGTSQATPTAAGAVAVLLSAARAEHLTVTPERLLTAVSSTARYLPNLPAYIQGNGLLQVGSALRSLQRKDAQHLTHIVFQAPVHTVTSWTLPVPNRGAGLFEREGWTPGARGDRTVYVTRQDGSPIAQRARIELVGNDGTFNSTGTITLPLHTAAALRIGILPHTPGVHSAILRLHSDNGTTLGETLLTIVAAEQFTSANGYTITHHISVPRPGFMAFFVTVPRNAQALLIRVASPRKGVYYNAHMPDATQSLNVSNNLLVGFTINKGVRQDIFPHPQPGVWEIIFSDLSDDFKHEKRNVHPTPVTVTTALISAAVEKTSDGARVQALQASAPTLTLTQQIAQVATDARTIRPGEQRVYTIEVPPGATGIGANLRSANGSLVNLYLFDCTKSSSSKQCIITTKSTETSATQYLYYDRPKPGLWKLVVDGYMASPTGSSYSLQRYYLAGLPVSGAPGTQNATAFTLGTLANDPDIYYNEGGIGEIKPREGLNPVIFDVRI